MCPPTPKIVNFFIVFKILLAKLGINFKPSKLKATTIDVYTLNSVIFYPCKHEFLQLKKIGLSLNKW